MWSRLDELAWIIDLLFPIFQRITEQAGVVLSLDPKPIEVLN